MEHLWGIAVCFEETCLSGLMKQGQMLETTSVNLGMPSHHPLARGKRMNAIAAFSADGVFAIEIVNSTEWMRRFTVLLTLKFKIC